VVKQDFFTNVSLIILCAAYGHPIKDKVAAEDRTDEKRKHAQRINRTNSFVNETGYFDRGNNKNEV